VGRLLCPTCGEAGWHSEKEKDKEERERSAVVSLCETMADMEKKGGLIADLTRGEVGADSGPWSFGGNVLRISHGGLIFWEVGGGKNGEENEGFVVRVVGRMHGAGGDVGGVTSGEVAVILVDPLFSLTGNDVDDFFAMRVGVKRVAVMRRHRDANQ